MKNKNDLKLYVLIGSVFTVWLGLLTAPIINTGIVNIIQEFPDRLNHPLNIEVCSNSFMVVGIFLLIYLMIVIIYITNRKNYRRREEHGSACWGDFSSINKKYMHKPISSNKILTQNVSIGFDGRKHRRNLNTLVIGGSGAGKTRFFAKPNVMQANTSLIVLDPKGEILRDEGNKIKASLKSKGFNVNGIIMIKNINLILVPLIVSILKRVQHIENAFKSKGYISE